MSKNTENIEHLVFKFNNGTITPGELELLMNWYNSHDDQNVTINTKTDESYDRVKSRILSNLLTKITSEQPQPLTIYRRYKWVAAAAAVLVMATGIWGLIEYKKAVPQAELVKTEIKAGGNKATLTLQNGTNIVLSSTQTGIVTGEKITYANGTPVENASLVNTTEIQKLTLHTPRGGTYTITLQDGTQVWLNAASSIRYPSRFNTEARVIELEGEAYFQVKTAYNQKGEKIPFRVITGQQEVEVLGTQFNINAYPDQAFSKTTLVEGKVVVGDHHNHITLKPDEQAVTVSGNTKVKQVQAGHYTAWRDGKFSFDGKTLEETMNDIARWYDLQIVYENGIPEEELTGDAYRNQNINFVFRLLNAAEIDYKLDVVRRKLTIKGKKNRM